MVWVLIALLIFIFQMATILLLEFRKPSKAVAWMSILFCFPLIGFAVYYFVAQDYKKHRQVRKRGSKLFREIRSTLRKQVNRVNHVNDMHGQEFQHHQRLFNLLNRLSENPITGCNRSEVLTDGEAAFGAMLAAMEKAKEHIHIEFYIFRNDVIGTQFQDVLIRKAQAGVKVRFVCDGLGSYGLKRSFVQKMKDAGVEVHFFLPPFLAIIDRRINYRNHRKIIVVDGNVGFVGGMNVGDDYLGQYPKMGYWRDTHLKIEGDAVYYLQNVFLNDWKLASGQQVSDKELFPVHECTGDDQIQIISSGPDQDWDAIQEMCFGAISVAVRRVWITTPYFIPDPAIYEALKTAAVSGVDVRIIIPWKADSRMVHLASLSYVDELLRVGVKFYQYRRGFIHAKVVIVDDLIASVGTANMDMRSFFSNFELTAALFEQTSINRLVSDFKEDLRYCSAIQIASFQSRPFLHKRAEMLCRMLSPLL